MIQQPARICILGGGFGGLYTALRLSQLPWEEAAKPEIILIDRSDRFLFTPLLYELVTGELQAWEIAPPFAEILANTNIRFLQATVTDIEPTEQRVHLQDGTVLPYDRLVLALGAETPLQIVPGAAEYAIPFRHLSDVYRLEERLRILTRSDLDQIRIAIAGGGYSGVELACKLADRLGDRAKLRIIEQGSNILANSAEFNRNAALKALEKRRVWLDLETTVQSIELEQISLLYKGQVDTIPVDLVLWTVGMQVSALVKKLPLKQNHRGQIAVESTLQTAQYPEIFALGDLAECFDAEGKKVPGTAQVAFQQSDYTAWNIWASLTNRPLLPFRYQQLVEMMALGKDNATISGLGIQLDGTAAYLLRRLAYLYRMPSLDVQINVGLNWISKPLQEFLTQF